MSENEVRAFSKTAIGVALARMIHLSEDGEPKILNDTIIAKLLGPSAQDYLKLKSDYLSGERAQYIRAHVVLRSRYAEDRLAEALQRGIKQVVILGAGLDTLAYRQPDWARDLRIYEVDHPASQAYKRERLEQAGIELPDNLSFCAIDFETTSLADGMSNGGIDKHVPTFFICLGVLMYLNSQTVMTLFRTILDYPKGSEIVFTYSDTSHDLPEASKALLASIGEPWLSFFAADQLCEDLGALGFSQAHIIDPDWSQKHYFNERTDNLQAPKYKGIGTAVV